MPMQYLTTVYFKLGCFKQLSVDIKVLHFKFFKLATLRVNITQQFKLSFINFYFKKPFVCLLV